MTRVGHGCGCVTWLVNGRPVEFTHCSGLDHPWATAAELDEIARRMLAERPV